MKKTDSAFIHTYAVDYSDVDQKRTLRPSHLLDYLQSISVKHSDFVGYDLDFFEKENLGWMLLCWHIEINRMPAEGEEMTISTWSQPYTKIQANRNFDILDSHGNEICYGASRWVLVDTKKRRPTKPKDGFFQPYLFTNCKAFHPEDFSMKDAPDREPDVISFTSVSRRDLDTNGHTNNAVYIDWATDTIPDDIYLNKRLTDIKVAYKRECSIGDKIKIKSWLVDDEVISVFTKGDELVLGQVVTTWI